MSSVIFKTLPEHFASRASVTEVVLNARIKRRNQRSGRIRIAQLKVEMVMEKRQRCKWKQVYRSDLEMKDEGKLPGAGRTFFSKQKYVSLNKKSQGHCSVTDIFSLRIWKEQTRQSLASLTNSKQLLDQGKCIAHSCHLTNGAYCAYKQMLWL